MATNLTNNKIKDTYSQLLHVDGGPGATEKTVYSGAGTATALKLGTGSVSIDNIQIDGNTISPLTGAVTITDVNITSGDISGITDLAVADGGTGASTAGGARANLGLGTLATQDASSVAITGGSIQNVTFTGSFSGMTLVQATNMLATGTTGYATGAGGTVTQTTSKSTAVTINKICGKITMHNAELANGAIVSFTVNNSTVAAADVVVANIATGATANTYDITVTAVASGSFRLQLHNKTNTGRSEAIGVNFAVIKAVTS